MCATHRLGGGGDIDFLPTFLHQCFVLDVCFSFFLSPYSKPFSVLTIGVTIEVIQNYYQMGRDFEQYVMQKLLVKKEQFKILNQRHDQLGPDGKPLPDNSNPDLEIEASWYEKKAVVAVECKFRSKWDDDRSVEWCREHNLKNYREFSKSRNIPVFVVLGIGGTPSSPLEMFCFRLTEHSTTRVLQRDMHNLRKPAQPGFFY